MAAGGSLEDAISQIRARLALGRRENELFNASPRGAAPGPGASPHSSLLATPASRHVGGRLTQQPSPSVLGAYERRLEADVGLLGPPQAAALVGSSRFPARGSAPASVPSPLHQPAPALEQPQHCRPLTAGRNLSNTDLALGGGGSSIDVARSGAVAPGLGAGQRSPMQHGSSMLLNRQTAPQPLRASGAAAAYSKAAHAPLAANAPAAADPLAAYRSPSTQKAAAVADSLAAFRPPSAAKASTAAVTPSSYAATQARLRQMQEECQRTAERNSAVAASAGGLGISALKAKHGLQQAQGPPLPSLQLQQLLERRKHQQPEFLISAAFPGSSAGRAASPAAQAASEASTDACLSKPGSREISASHKNPTAAAAQGDNADDSPAALTVRLGPVFDSVLVDTNGKQTHSTAAAAAAAASPPAVASTPARDGSGGSRPLAAQHALPAASLALLLSRQNELEAQVRATSAGHCLHLWL